MRTGMCRCDMTREARGQRRGPFQWERALGVSITRGTAAFPAARVLRAAADTLCPELGGAQCSLATPAGTGGKCTVPWHERLHLLLSSQPEASQQRGSAAGECYQHSLGRHGRRSLLFAAVFSFPLYRAEHEHCCVIQSFLDGKATASVASRRAFL